MKVSKANKLKNSNDLIAHFKAKHERALAEPEGVLRDIAMATAKDSEWYTLYSALWVEPMCSMFHAMTLAQRLDEIKDAMYRKYDASKAVV